MQYIYPQFLPSPLQGLDTAVGTLADAVIRSRERQGLSQDMDLISQAIVKAQAAGMPKDYGDVPEPGETAGNPLEVLQEGLGNMKTTWGKSQMIRLMNQMQPQPVYGMEDGQLMRKGSLPKGAQLLKEDPMARQLALEDKKQQGREKLQTQKEEWQERLETQRQSARDARDWKRYNFMNQMLTRRLDLQEKLAQQKTEKDRSGLARRELVNIKQRAKENFNRKITSINKEFKDVMSPQFKDEKAQQEAMAQARQEYDADLQEIQTAYKDVIDKYGIKVTGVGGGPGKPAAFKGPGRYRGPDGQPVAIRTKGEYERVFGRGLEKGGNVLTALPDPALYAGKVARDTVTGKRFKSDGKQWKLME